MRLTKKTILLIAIISVISFLALVYYGLSHARGVPVVIEKPERVILEVPFISKDIDLTKGISLPEWETIPSQEVELMYQVMVLPWGKSLVSPVTVRAFHNGEEIYFYMSWKDDSENRNIDVDEFSDAAAIMFPLADEVPPSTIMMGFMGNPGANIWQWKASQDTEYWLKELPETEAYSDFYYPFEEQEVLVVSKEVPRSAVNDLIARGVGTITPKETQNVLGRGLWDKGTWYVVFRRSLKPTDPQLDAAFSPGGGKLSAFAIWNGAKGDRGGRKSISDWVELEIKGEE
ncbi:ethylbenzene dehydrogenase-related protein [Candidatus Hakubella thermalkaliphila]|uniref:Cytochrome c-552/DMSO reductase-like haem-binding domain-containing protein n=1 Tax=Candidatus Hakubella thermalkaliphila TaxID=2754717 RepID=A0A6V8PAS2_9ACTN|nr:ethylbenzene dehydrogenase-related protein [Candidatus Hakubella thermalkaliphila]GFP29377.1 hypothetical protein HKBW3S34_00297 [Candidatus Hakubella thermalkaliphila]